MGERTLLDKIRDRQARVAVLGQGYVRLVVAMRTSEAGFPVIGLEVDRDRAEALADGRSYVEDVPDEVLGGVLDRGYRPTSDPQDLDGFDVAVISVPTPLREGAPDLSFVESAGRMLAPHVRPGCVVILESTTYPGTTEELLGPILESNAPDGLKAGRDFLLGYSPERIDPGNPQFGLENTPKVVSGINEESLAAVDAFFSAFVTKTVPVSTCGAAELCKVLENTLRHVNIALVNELAKFASDLGIDVFESIESAATKPFGYMKFTPGPGVGGHCLPIDPTYLSWQVKQRLGENFRFVELANEVNEAMPQFVVRRTQAALNSVRKPVNGSRIVILGISYKPNVGDSRETPSIPIIQQLLDLGGDVVAVDPYAHDAELPESVELVRHSDGSILENSDLAVIVTDHDVFDYHLVAQTAPLVLDTRNRLAGVEGRHIHRF